MIEDSQQEDGTWGRFHTQDTKIKQPIPTTQNAISLALYSGLDGESPVIRRLMPTLLDYVHGKYIWPDWPEKHDNPDAWPIWVRHYSAGELARIDCFHPSLDEFWRIRAESVTAAFAGGTYDRRREIEVLVDLLECRIKNPVPFHAAPSLHVLGATKNRLSAETEEAMLRHLLESDVGIYYVINSALGTAPGVDDRRFWAWLNGQKLLAPFPAWKTICVDLLNTVWSRRGHDGFWDTDAKIPRWPYSCFPLSESWRRRENRKIDISTAILSLLIEVNESNRHAG